MADARRLFLVVFVFVLAAGQAAVGMRASRTASTTGDEPFYLLTAQSLQSDGDLDLRDEYRKHEYREFWDGTVLLWKQMTPAPDGRLLAPHDPGLPLLVLPAYAVGGLRGVQRFLVLLWAAAMACAALLARRAGAPPWAAALAAVVVGAGTPGVVYASQVYPEGSAALAVALGLLLATGERARPFLLALVLIALAWLGVKYVPLGMVVAFVQVRRHGIDRRALAVLAVAAVHYLWWHVHTFGGLTPYSTNIVWSGEGDSSILADHVDWSGRSYRLYGLFLDARFGLFRWLPLAVLALWGIRRRTTMHAGVLAVCVLMGTFVSITMMGWWFPGRMLLAGFGPLAVLVALGAARLPRTAVVLGAWSLTIAVALVVAARTGDVRPAVDPFTVGFPLAPAALLPDFRGFGARQVALSGAWVAALTMLLWRSSSSSTATRWPTAPSSPFPPTWRLRRAR
jgi:hypothetical protein